MKRIYCICIIFCLLLCLAGCDTYALFDAYPENRSTVWYCEEIDFEIRYVPNEYGNLVTQTTTITCSGVSYSVVGVFNYGNFLIILEDDELTTDETEILLSGEWEYEGKNVVVEITEDKIFDNDFEKLVFKPMT